MLTHRTYCRVPARSSQGLFVVTAALLVVSAAVPTVEAQQEPATGFAFWVRAPGGALQDLFSSGAGAPQFAVGYRGRRFGLGFGAGLTMLNQSDEDSFTGGTSKGELSLTMFQVGPSAWLDIWQSEDGRTAGSIVTTVSIGRLSASDKDEFTPTGGQPQINEVKSTGTLLGVRLGLGGNHFLHRHFALGMEAGLQLLTAFGIEEEGFPDQKFGLGANGTYASFKIMVVF